MNSSAPVSRPRLALAQVACLSLLRLVIAWHFLYEGLVKALDPNWTSAGFLLESGWVGSGWFHWIAGEPRILQVVDLLNVWGLIAIGMSLFLGILTRWAYAAAILLLALYYMASPAIPGHMSETGLEGHYLFVNRNVLEAVALCLLLAFPESTRWGLGGLLSRRRRRRAPGPAGGTGAGPAEPPSEARVAGGVPGNRREVLTSLASLPFLGAFILGFWKNGGRQSFEERHLLTSLRGPHDAVTGATRKTAAFAGLKDLRTKVPHGRIGQVEISRLICGGNLISGFAHARDLIYVSSLLKQYFTDEKVMETLRLCEACGINTAILRTDQDTIRILHKYWKKGGRIQWLAQVYPKEDDLTTNARWAIENGAVGGFVQGNIADRWTKAGRVDALGEVIEFIRSRGKIGGTAAHDLAVPKAVHAARIPVDFYMKTLHDRNYWSLETEEEFAEVVDNKHDNYWCLDPEGTIEFMRTVETPWIAYKVLAAGAIAPQAGLRHAFSNGADFACMGMFDFQVVQDANILTELWPQVQQRERRWLA